MARLQIEFKARMTIWYYIVLILPYSWFVKMIGNKRIWKLYANGKVTKHFYLNDLLDK